MGSGMDASSLLIRKGYFSRSKQPPLPARQHVLLFFTLPSVWHHVAKATAHPVLEVAPGKRVWQLPGVNRILQVMRDLLGGVVQDGADEVVLVVVVTGVGFTEGRGPMGEATSLHRGSLGASHLLHAEHHQLVLHDGRCWVGETGEREVWVDREGRGEGVESRATRESGKLICGRKPCKYVSITTSFHGCTGESSVWPYKYLHSIICTQRKNTTQTYALACISTLPCCNATVTTNMLEDSWAGRFPGRWMQTQAG